MSFVHLHSHSYYSLLDGLGSPKAMVEAVKAQGSPALALTDHGVLYGAIEFYKAAKAAGIKPIIGCEIYVATRTRFDKTPQIDVKPYHLTVLSANNEGYQNLLILTTKAHLEGFYYKPRVDFGLLKAYGKGLIALSGCLAGELARTILTGDMEQSVAVIRKYQEIFGVENYYLELQDHPYLEEQHIVNTALITLSKQTGAKLVATNDAHYVHHDHAEAHDILLCIQTQSTVIQENRMKYIGDFSLRSPENMKQAFAHVPEAIENTLEIADKCNLDLDFGQNLLPTFHTPGNLTPQEYLTQLCEEGLKQRYGDPPPEKAVAQLKYELSIVHQMGFDSYFLIVQDFINYAKEQGIMVGPGRGSAAGSIIAYVLRITELDPLKYGLIFERFLNPARISMPDIDIDFADDRRSEVLDYVVNKYGRENVAQIITFGTMAPRASVRDTGRALGFPYSEVDRIAKLVPPPLQGKHVHLKDSIKDDPDLHRIYDQDPRAKILLDRAIQLEGTVRHAGTHACAVVISDKPLVNFTALQFSSRGDKQDVVTQFSMKPIEELGLLKMDFLGLKNLTLLEKALHIIQEFHGVKIDFSTLPEDDPETFALLQKGETTGVFQLESTGMKRYLKQLKPTKFEDIVAMVSLYRPGPMEWIPTYIKGKHHPETVHYLHPSFSTILSETYGVAIYQEQILQIAQQFAGFGLGEADLLRKAVGKKIPALLQEQKIKFIEGAVQKGYDQTFSEKVFEDVIEPFAGYGFNKAHAACYGMIAYQTAYLKAHYPAEFMTALLSCDQENMERVAVEISECEDMGISVLPPALNESERDFTFLNSTTIRFGLSAIKGLGDESIREILRVRKESGKFVSLEGLAKRIPAGAINKKMIESLAYGGALDEMGDRRQIAQNYEEIITYAKFIQTSQETGQTDIFALLDDHSQIPEVQWNLAPVIPLSRMEKLKLEKDYLGLYVTSHPLQGLKKYLSKKVTLLERINQKMLRRRIKIGGLVSGVRKILTKSGTYMLMATLEDPTGKISVVVFPRAYKTCADFFQEDSVVFLEGKLDYRRDEYQISVESAKAISLDRMVENAKHEGLFDEKEKIVRTFKNTEKPDEEKEADSLDEPSPSIEDETTNDHSFLTFDNDTVSIHFYEQADPALLKSIKDLLTASPGAQSVEIILHEGASTKRIKVPFGVAITEELKQKVGGFLSR